MSPQSAALRAVRTIGLAAVAAGLISCKVAGGPFVSIPVSAFPAETTTFVIKASFGGQEKTQQFKTTDLTSPQVLTFELPNGASGTLAVHVDASDGSCVLAAGDASLEITADAAYETSIQLQPQPLSGCSFTTYALSVTPMQRNSATGSVVSDIPGIDCGTRCSADYRPNTAVTLQARVPVGSRVVSWSEASCNSGPDLHTCTVTLTSKKDVTVTFDSCKGVWCNESPVSSGSNNLRAVWASSPTLIYAAGDGPTLLRYDGAAWRTEVLPGTAGTLRGVASPRSTLFPVAVGDKGTVLHNSLAGWTQATATNLPSTQVINAAGGYDINSLYVIGDGGFIRWWQPSTSTYLPVTKDPGTTVTVFPPQANLNAITPLSLSNPVDRHLIVGDGGFCATGEPADTKGKYKLLEQSPVCNAAGKNLYGAWYGTAVGYIVGAGGTIIRFVAGATTSTAMPMTSGTTATLRAVWGQNDTTAYAVGAGGVILRYDGASWTPQTSGTTRDLNGVWGLSNGEVYAVGQSGTILHYFP